MTSADLTNPTVLRETIAALFRPAGPDSLHDRVDSTWTQDATLKTPMFTVKGRDDLYRLFHLWQNVFDDRLEILDVASQGDKVMVRIQHNLTLRPLNIARHLVPDAVMKLLSVPLIISATLDTTQTARGRRLSGWYEDVSVYTLIYNVLWLNKLVNVHDWVELVLGKALTTADEVGRVAYHVAAPWLLPLLDRALQAADSLGKSHLHRDLGLYHSSRSIWS